MQKIKNKKIVFLASCFLSLIAIPAFASNIKINASILPSVWYSETTIFADDSIKIFSAIQNHSDFSFKGQAILYIDDTQKSKVAFVSKPDDLLEIDFSWKALKGNHSLQIKINEISNLDQESTTTLGVDSLISSDSNKATLSVGEHLTFNNVKDTALNTATAVVDSIDKAANNLADKIDDLKKPTSTKEIASSALSKDSSVKSVSKLTNLQQKATTTGGILNSKVGTSVYNTIIDFLSKIVRNWKITGFVIIALALIVKFMI